MAQQIAASGQKVHLISLGCARNRADAEVMLGGLLAKGWEITDTAAEASAIVVNTCGFIGAAKEESIDTILEATDLKKEKPELKVVVSGCLSQRYKTQLVKGFPEVDLFIGTDEFPKLPDLLMQAPDLKQKLYTKRTNYLYEGELPKLNTLSKHSAYVKVAEGCQHQCSFCIIPAIRGPLRSRPIESTLAEVTRLAQEGVKEVNLIAQDLAAYGRDRGRNDLLPLLKALVKVEGIDWIRMLYVYPENISKDFLDFFASERKLVKYLDIPMQHASDRILKKMNRQVTRAQLEGIVNAVRQAVPGIAVRTTVMVGFPGETAEDFAQLKDFVQTMRFDHLGCFMYSQEEGTVAGRMPDQISDELKQQRYAEIMQVQQDISRDIQQQHIGKVFDVLVEGCSADSELVLQGRLATQAPEVDGVVYLEDSSLPIGSIQKIKITKAFEYDLVGSADLQ